MPQQVFDQLAAGVTADRFTFFTEWKKNFCNLEANLGSRISAEAVQDSWNAAVSASPHGAIACVPTWHTDFRADLPKIDIPVLVMHGTEDRILPIEACGPRTHELLPDSHYVPSKAHRTASPGPMPTRSTPNSCAFSSSPGTCADPGVRAGMRIR